MYQKKVNRGKGLPNKFQKKTELVSFVKEALCNFPNPL